MSSNRSSQQAPPTQRRVPQIPHFISIYDYLATLQSEDLSKLYASQASCLAIFRLLPELSKLIINYWLFTGDDKNIKKDDILLWFSASDQKAGYQALNSVIRLGILTPVRPQQDNNQEASTIRARDNTEFQMNSAFKQNLQNALTCNSDKNTGFGVVHQNPSQDINIEALDTYSKIRWENLLYFMVGTSTNEKPPSTEMLQLLTHSGLMSRSQNSGRYQITHYGFQFLLQDPHVQVWDLLLQYLHFKSEANPMDLLNFYFLLSSLQLGVCYDASNLPDSIKELMNDLKNCGFIYRDKRDRNQYYPTRLATSLGSMKTQGLIGSATTLSTSDNSVAAPLNPLNSSLDSNETDATPDHFIVLETNYNVYAYTNSRLHISILNLFLTLKCRFSNMVIAHLDRQSIRRALTKGITAEQILQYLTAHAHPLMLKRTPVLPVTVVDQIRLWAIEKNRLYDQAATLYRGFSQAADFQNLLNILQKRRPEAILWTNERKLIIVVSQEGHRIIKSYYQERAKQGQ